MAWLSGLWGWGGWLVVVLLPLSLWAIIALVVAVVFLRRRAAAAGAPVELLPSADSSAADAGVLGWAPPVASHQ